MPSLPDANAAFHEKTTRLIDQPCAAMDQAFTGAMQCLQIKLFGRLHGNETHCRTARRLGYSLRIPIIVLMDLHIGAHIQRRHQSGLMTQILTKTSNVMSAATGLHRDSTGR